MPKRKMIAGAVAMTAALAVISCSKKDEADKAGDAAARGDQAPATAQTPKLRAGVWSVSVTGEGQTGATRMCLNDDVQERMSVFGAQAAGGSCDKTTLIPNPGGGWRYRTTCDYSASGGGVSVSEGVMTGDMKTRYTSRSTVTTTGASVAHMNGTITVVGEGTYEGACPADMKPGDMVIPGGMKFNMLEMADMAAKMAPPKPAT